MKAHVYLTITRTGVVKMTKEKPAIGRGQRLVRLQIQVPDSAFFEPAILDCELDIPADRLAYPAITGPVEVEVWPA